MWSRRDLILIVYPVFSLCLSHAMLYMTVGTEISVLGNLIVVLLLIGLLLSSVLVFFIYVKIIEDYAVKRKTICCKTKLIPINTSLSR